jgi:O-antigen ligase
VLMLCGWGLLDKRLSRRSRALLIASPLAFALLWGALAAWAHHSQHVFGGDAQLAKGDISASRFAIWSNTLSLIARHPWLGVGWGEFNLAWSLTPFPGRPVAFFDHTHNLPRWNWACRLRSWCWRCCAGRCCGPCAPGRKPPTLPPA